MTETPKVLAGEKIVCISSVDWEPIWTRKQQVMSRLPASNDIIYVEPPVTLLSPFKDPAAWAKWRKWRRGVVPWNKNICLYSPPVVAPFGNMFRWVNDLNQGWISLFLRQILRRLGWTDPIIWTYLPNSLPLIRRLPRKLVVYDCVDEHSEYAGLINKQLVRDMERQLMAACDITFVTAPGLYRDKRDWAREIYYLPNAADVEHFQKAASPETPVPPEMAGLPRPVLGYVGVIREWVDLDLLAYLARARPEWSLVLIGPAGPGVDLGELQRLPNVHLLGYRERRNLPGYLKGFDVCLNVFKLNQLTERVSPLKFYEYLATGKPVVSVDMPGVRDFADVIEIASGREEFLAAVERALAEETPQKAARRLERSRANSWDSRVRFMMEKITDKLSSKEM